MTLVRVITADPPWSFDDKLPGEKRGGEKFYKCMTLSEIMRMPLPPIADDAVLFLWRVSSMVPEAYDVVRAWGFKAKSEIVWNKTAAGGQLSIGMGRIVRGSHETCIVATRGHGIVPTSKGERTSFLAPRGEHSAKPEEFYQIVERLYPLELWPEAHVELFARRRRPGWIQFGDELPPEGAPDGAPSEPAQSTAEPDQPTAAPKKRGRKPKAVEIPTDWQAKPGNDAGASLVRPTTRARDYFDGRVWRPIGEVRANTLIEPPAPRVNGSWSSVRALVVRDASDWAASGLGASSIEPVTDFLDENMGVLAQNLIDRGFHVNLLEIAAMTPLQRGVLGAFLEQGGDPPPFLASLSPGTVGT
jgi:N6-adenosine-specific RNA methylase IME4